MRGRMILACTALATAITVTGTATALAGHKRGFRTEQPSMLTPVRPGVQVTPLMTVGDRLRNGYRFEAIPDGISLRTGRNRVEVFVNHETGKVPFPFDPASAHRDERRERLRQLAGEPADAQPASGGVLGGRFAITSSLGYQRFCSNYLATCEGGVRPRDPLHERGVAGLRVPARGLVAAADRRPERARGGPRRGARRQERQARPDPRHGQAQPREQRPDPGVRAAGRPLRRRHVHERPPHRRGVHARRPRAVAAVLLHRTGHQEPAQRRRRSVGLRLRHAGRQDYYDVPPELALPVTGHFIKVPRKIATGLNPRRVGGAVRGRRVPRPADNGSWQIDLRSSPGRRASTAPSGSFSIGATSTTCSSSSASRTSRTTNVVEWGTSSTSWTRAGVGPASGPRDGQPNFRSTNGRVWKMVLDPDHPKQVTSLTVFVEGDDNPVKTPERDPPAGQPRVDAERPAGDGGPGIEPAVPGAGPGATRRDHRAALVRAARESGGPLTSWRGSTSPPTEGPTDVDGRPTRQPGRMGVDRHRRRLEGVRPRHVPDQRPGAHALGRQGAG